MWQRASCCPHTGAYFDKIICTECWNRHGCERSQICGWHSRNRNIHQLQWWVFEISTCISGSTPYKQSEYRSCAMSPASASAWKYAETWEKHKPARLTNTPLFPAASTYEGLHKLMGESRQRLLLADELMLLTNSRNFLAQIHLILILVRLPCGFTCLTKPDHMSFSMC